ncbi:MAG: L-carnitine dehydratase/bile acid-inducible protein [Phenylobacterium sp.]|uniref:CaiB/BaiF CoA transferase family protein n=1 Tax=Phenylobacterium sp. TaxID=1871053 RepID=UPI002619C547|nr:CoA transferase [Phenylobacterium sp.]MDB5497298.1 L-carnitine dehydratase/bile acid-inducible protein [Phenylobacterium sp.]
MADRILEGVRILDFGRYIAGPFCAALLADLGADVIRVERVDGGEDRYIYRVADAGDGALFLQMNRNKRGITMDPKAPGSAEILRRLVAKSNVVIANLPNETLHDLGLDYESLAAIRPDVILTAISAFGSEGPYASQVGFDGVGQAMSGAAYLSGFDRPTKSFASWVDMMSASLAAFGTMAAIHEHARNGRGQVVQASLFTSALTAMNFPLIEQALTGVERERTGNRGQSGAPADFFETRDGWIVVQVLGEPLFRRWARLVGQVDWLGDSRFATDALRADNGEVLSARTAAWCADLTTEDALARLAEARIPAGPVLSPREALQDRHVREAGLLVEMDFPGADRTPLILPSIGLTQTPARLWRRAPTLGEHTDEVLAELGFSAVEIAGFRTSRAI